MQDGVNRLSHITIDGFGIWQKYLTFGSSIACYWGDTLSATRASISQMISTVQIRRAA